jgi:hypothetical protein
MNTHTETTTMVTCDDGDTTYPAVLSDETWNGFVIPRFDRPTAERIAQDIASAGYFDGTTAEFDTDGTLVVTYAEDEVERYAPDADALYAIGGGSWAWATA